MVRKYVPEKGDIVWLDFNPQAGKEQMGRRPALVLSHKAYNDKVGMAIFCPITSRIKGYPFEVKLPVGMGVEGMVLSDQVRNLDWTVRNVGFIEKMNLLEVEKVVRLVKKLID